ncbi:transposase [Paenibacillus sp. V4I7]|uniref:transposase n=1 Tax=Paenibacillus sp. V4I7 TaxID=3042307 RepID=UPI002785FE54|nr:transposase [Paenibacillus sp. V4I7]MDQ0899893.1 transposase [Paenibacillus sp. V4I7]
MTGPRRKFSPEEKARLVLEILKEEKTLLSQLAAEEGIHTNVLNRWKLEVVQNRSQLFVDDRKGIMKMKQDYEQQIDELYGEVGKLTTQLSWLKKKIWPLIFPERNESICWNGTAPNTLSWCKRIYLA